MNGRFNINSDLRGQDSGLQEALRVLPIKAIPDREQIRVIFIIEKR